MVKVVPTVMVVVMMVWFSSVGAVSKEGRLFPAFFVFGDSLIDPGNNNHLKYSRAKSNYPPYGIDFALGPTGRFSNGKTFLDLIGELVGLPLLPSYADVVSKGANILSGVNYASAGAGILHDSGYIYGDVITLREQIDNFKNTLNQLRKQVDEKEMNNYLANALVVLEMGANDCIDTHLYPPYKTINPQQFTDLLINLYTQYILEIKNLGLRKLLIMEVSPFGCIPFFVNTGLAPQGECVSSKNDLAQTFNSKLKSLVRTLNSDYPDTVFTLLAAFQPFIDLRNNAHVYGFKVKDKACCVAGPQNSPNITERMCLRSTVPCSNRDEYLFWDFAHGTQAVYKILANHAFNSTSCFYPYSLHQIAQM